MKLLCYGRNMHHSSSNPGESDYTAHEKWPYRTVFFITSNTRTRLGVGEGFYEASLDLVKELAVGRLSEDLEGVAAVYLFRHYLELSLNASS